MKVTVCQLDPREDHLDRFLAALKEHVAAESSDFVLLPEMCFSEWLAADRHPDPERWAQAIERHDTYIDNLGEVGAAAIVGTRPTVNSRGSRRNEAYIWTTALNRPAPIREKYYLPDEEGFWEHSWYDRGSKSFDTALFRSARVGVQICTEMWFLEWARHYAASRVDLLCIPRATPHESVDKWLAGGRTAAVCSGAYTLSSNLWYPPGNRVNCGGLGWIIDPEGNILDTTRPDAPFATAEIDLAFSRASKSTYPRYVPE
ncbi:MAG: carbon-nitrogen hydrolase family protein [Desulfosarcinaceae bacterium]|nr:carbon-nitrogen hydrolase family protein [Desulfosarcinaceae bacterium]